MSAGIGSNGRAPCVNKTKGSPFTLSMHHISHSMLGHTVALRSLEKIVNAFTVFSEVYYNRYNFTEKYFSALFLARIVANRETRLFSLFLGLGDIY
jgi:hypothetical protein